MRLKNILPDVLMIITFMCISILYFWNPITEGKVLHGVDNTAGIGLSGEQEHYRATHNGERTRWVNNVFSGMPTYQISPSYGSTDILFDFQTIYQLGLPHVAAYLFMLLLGFYILLRAFDFRTWMAALGAVLWAFSSYYFIIIAAGHIWKFLTLCFIPPTLAGVVLCYRGKYLWGMFLTALFSSLQIFSNHVQMSYYFLFVMFFMVLGFAYTAFRQSSWTAFFRASGCVLVGGLLGIAVNASNLYHTYQYSKESMRSKSELTHVVKNAADQTDSGLERSYITAWSYGIGETWTLLVPNVKGGASVPLRKSKEAMSQADSRFLPIYDQLGQYWGEQPGTSGPVYVGAFVVFLFVLGLFIVPGSMKWALLAATLLSILLSWGHNFMLFTDFFLDYVPMYDKFRTVASILVIAEFAIPLLAMLALKRIIETPDFFRSCSYGVSNSTWIYVALGFTGGVCLLFWLLPDMCFGTYVSQQELQGLQSLAQYGWPVNEVLHNLQAMRRAMFTADAARSLVVVMVGYGILMAYRLRRIGALTMTGLLALLCLGDMWGVNKRYLNDDNFTNPKPAQQTIPATVADEVILADSIDGRVVNLSVSTFNDNTTSFRHRSIGGYHPAKLRRYQELIEEHLSKELMLVSKNIDTLRTLPVLNMLNTRYFIGNAQMPPIKNPYAAGDAWFVDKISYVANADAELLGLHGLNIYKCAIADRCFEEILGQGIADSTANVHLSLRESNLLRYEVNTQKGGVMVMSEIYYPGWTCSIDGQPAGIGRVNYVLRALRVGPGKHTVELRFDPQSLHTTETIAYSALVVMALLFVFLLVVQWRKKYQKDKKDI